ncbi:MAG: fused MFS/spermidine synthase [Candidatus Binatales bacterium]
MAQRAKKSAAAAPAAQASALSLAAPLATAFLTGIAGLLIEVVGARALAPFFGSSLMVWTAQITATLLFLALGYELGGRICRNPRRWHLPILLLITAVWLSFYPALRSTALGMSSAGMGVASGSFVSAIVLFGLPLLCIGAVSPVLVSYIDLARPGAGSAAGSLFFISTIGGLAGGWIAVLVVIPYLSVRLCIVGTGVIMALVGVAWSLAGGSRGIGALCIAVFAMGLLIAASSRSDIVLSPTGLPVRVLYSQQSDVGLIRVIDAPAKNPIHRALLINGVVQGGIDSATHKSYMSFVDQMTQAGRYYHPHAKDALLLGLGAGLLPTQLYQSGMKVTVVELDPKIEYVARKFFDMPPEVTVKIADGRSFLRSDSRQYDLIFLDVFAGEDVPWYLLTVEAFREIQAHLRAGGRLVINAITDEHGTSPGMIRLVADVHAVFPGVAVYLCEGDYGFQRRYLAPGAPLVYNAVVVAGANLEANTAAPGASDPLEGLDKVNVDDRAAQVRPSTDDRSDIDYADQGIRAEHRQLVIGEFGADILGD